jgi:hypothetical protein
MSNGFVQTVNYDAISRTTVNDADLFIFYEQPLVDAEGAKRQAMIELLKEHGGLTYVCGR